MDNLLILFDKPVLIIQLLVNGLLIGAIFALAAYGMALVWGVMEIINIAQGEQVILGGFITYFLTKLGIHPLFGVAVSSIVLYVFGLMLYRIVIFRVVDRDLFISILATFGISIVLQQFMNQVFGADIQNAEAGLGTFIMLNGDITIARIKIVSFFTALIVGFLLVVFLKKSRMGQAIRATAQNARAARIMGIDTDRVYASTFAINSALCGAAGALVAMTWVIHPFIGIIYTVRSFMIVVIAGVGNMAGVVAAGLGLGAAENMASFILGAEFQSAFVFTLLVLILVERSFRLNRQRKVLK